MTKDEALKLVRDVLAEILGADPGELSMDMNIVELELLDSLDIETFILSLREKLKSDIIADDKVDYDLFVLDTLTDALIAS